ncbi:MAG: hypothetical protein ACM3YE_14180 [Bacteroidota bacterium]
MTFKPIKGLKPFAVKTKPAESGLRTIPGRDGVSNDHNDLPISIRSFLLTFDFKLI